MLLRSFHLDQGSLGNGAGRLPGLCEFASRQSPWPEAPRRCAENRPKDRSTGSTEVAGGHTSALTWRCGQDNYQHEYRECEGKAIDRSLGSYSAPGLFRGSESCPYRVSGGLDRGREPGKRAVPRCTRSARGGSRESE